VRIPKSFAQEAGLEEDAPIDMSLAEGKLLIQRASAKRFSLEELLAGITEENLHGEVSTGPAAGNESW
jgi:antitoxin MazE